MPPAAQTPRPEFEDVSDAARRIRRHVCATPVVSNEGLNRVLGCDAFFKCENLQDTGSFKLRGASNAVLRLQESGNTHDVATHSSGNHGAAVARAAKLCGRQAHVVMPRNAVLRKVESVRQQGGRVIFCDPTQQAREAGLAALVARGMEPIPPYDHPDVISGQGTAALELMREVPELQIVMTPVGGGGLVSGTAIVARHLQAKIRVFAAEPAGAADTAASFAARQRVSEWRPDTIADGLRAVVGRITFPIILELVDDILTVSEDAIRAGVELAWRYLGQVIEPSSATVLAAVLEHPGPFAGRRVGMIFSGGNIDPQLFPEIGGNS